MAKQINAIIQEEGGVAKVSDRVCEEHERYFRKRGYAKVCEVERQRRIQSGQPILGRQSLTPQQRVITFSPNVKWTPELDFMVWSSAQECKGGSLKMPKGAWLNIVTKINAELGRSGVSEARTNVKACIGKYERLVARGYDPALFLQANERNSEAGGSSDPTIPAS